MREIAFHVFTTTSLDRDDGSPVQVVSKNLLAYYGRCEAMAGAFGALLLGEVVAVAIIFVTKICQ